MIQLCLVAALLVIALPETDASHFRGGTVSWRYLGQIGGSQQVEINYRFGWRLNSGSPRCDADSVKNQNVSYSGQGSWRWRGGIASYSTINQTTGIKCTSFDNSHNWAYGYNSFVTSVTTTGPFHVSYEGYAWISARYASGSWAVAATNIDFSPRSDTGAANRPPRTLSRPVVRLSEGCPEDIAINYLDDDNDVVRCRYAGTDSNAPVNECGSACNGPSSTGYPHFTLNETTCELHYDGGGGTYLIAVSLVLEDYPRTPITLNGTRSVSTNQSLSQIPLQFIVQISASSSCNVVPTYPSYTIQNGEIVTIASRGGLNTTLYAYPSSVSYTISQFVTIGPLGLQTSAAYFVGSNLYAASLTWFPSSSQSGSYTACYYAVDSGGVNGKQICFTLTIAAIQSPCQINNGGCSDVCTASGAMSICSCSLPCWSLQRDGKTCAPNMNVTCDGSALRISMDTCASNRTVVAGHSFNHITQSRCQSSVLGNQHYMALTRSDCGLVLQASPIQVQYASQLWVWNGYDTGSSIITRGHYRPVPVVCSLAATSSLAGSFVPELPFNNESFPTNVDIQGFGSFSLYFQFYRSSSYATALSPSDFPLQVTVSDLIYFSLGAVGQPGFVFFTQECVASSSSGSSVLSYTFIQNGCYLDPTLRRQPSNDPMQERFVMEAFEFENNLVTARQNAEISIQCTVMICDAADNSSRCFQGCLPSAPRRRRSTEERVKRDAGDNDDDDDDDIQDIARPSNPESPIQQLKTRFILLVEKDNAGEPEGAAPSYVNWILIAFGAVFLLIALFVAYRVLNSKRLQSRRQKDDSAVYATVS